MCYIYKMLLQHVMVPIMQDIFHWSSCCMLCSKSSQSCSMQHFTKASTVSLLLVDMPITCDQSIASYHISSVMGHSHRHNRGILLLKLSWKHLAGSFVALYHNLSWHKSDSARISRMTILSERNFPHKLTTNLLQILWQQGHFTRWPPQAAALIFKLISRIAISSISREVALCCMPEDD